MQRPYSEPGNIKQQGPNVLQYPAGTHMALAADFSSISLGLRGRNGFDPEKHYSERLTAFSVILLLQFRTH